MNVLLIEPDKVISDTVLNAFKNAGYNVVCKKNAQTALDSLDDNIPDIIVLEIQLGLHNGIEFLYETRSYTEWANIPVIIHTINSKSLDKQFVRAFSGLKVHRVLYKPKTSTGLLLRTVSQTMSKV